MSNATLPSAINLDEERTKMYSNLGMGLGLTLISLVVDNLPEIMSFFGASVSGAFQYATLIFGLVILASSTPFYFHYIVSRKLGSDLKTINDKQLEEISSRIKDHPELEPFARDIKKQQRVPVKAEYNNVILYAEIKEKSDKDQETRGLRLWESL